MDSVPDEVAEGASSDVPTDTWSVAQVNDEIKTVLADASNRFPRYVIGEIADISQYDFAAFFDLADTDAEARISCLAWANSIDKFDHELEAGVTAVVEASVDHYPEQGRTQLIVRDYWPVGESQRVEELEQLRTTLSEEGAFDEQAKQPLPTTPRQLGVVTSPSGSAREDVVSTIGQRWPLASVCLCGASVQGDSAVADLVGAIQQLEHDPTIEVIIVTRGGGADATLWCFNEEPVVRTIITCTTPVVVAVGHEDDATLAERVADKRAMTPTAAGVVTTPDVETLQETADAVERRIEGAYTALVEERLTTLADRIEAGVTAVEQATETRDVTRQRVVDLDRRVTMAYETLVTNRLTALDRRIDDATQAIEQTAATEQASMTAARGRVDDLEARIERAYTQTAEAQLQTIDQRISVAYRDIEADTKVQTSQAETQRLRAVIAVLIVLLLLVGGVALVLLL